MDALDRKILALLVEDGRRSLADLGLRVGLSSSAVKRRVDRLHASGAIAGYAAIVDPAAMGWETEAFIEVTCEGSRSTADLHGALAELPEVHAAYTVSGEADALVHLRVRDIEHLEQAIERLHALALVARTKTSIVLSRIVARGAQRAAGDG